MLIQFATNRRRVEEDEDDLDYEEDEEEELRERVSADGRKKKITRKEAEYMAADVMILTEPETIVPGESAAGRRGN